MDDVWAGPIDISGNMLWTPRKESKLLVEQRFNCCALCCYGAARRVLLGTTRNIGILECWNENMVVNIDYII